jgi:bifunctional DNase/RNase
MNKVNLEIVGLTYSESSTGAYVLILGDKNSQRRLPIVIGSAEAESIAVGLEKHKNGRPHTHDLFLRFAHEFGIEIMEVVINRFRDGVYYAMLVCQQGNELVMIDARPSDAIALAVRLNCDIYAYESVMEEAGIVMEDTEKETNLQNTEDASINKVPPTTSLDLIPLDELEDLLQEAIDDEDYQKAAQIRDEINKRK